MAHPSSTRHTVIPASNKERLGREVLLPVITKLIHECDAVCEGTPHVKNAYPAVRRLAHIALCEALFEYCKSKDVRTEVVYMLCRWWPRYNTSLFRAVDEVRNMHAHAFGLQQYMPSDFRDKQWRYTELTSKFIDQWFDDHVAARLPRLSPPHPMPGLPLQDLVPCFPLERAAQMVMDSLPVAENVHNGDTAHRVNAMAIMQRHIQETLGWSRPVIPRQYAQAIDLRHLWFAGKSFTGKLRLWSVTLDWCCFKNATFGAPNDSAGMCIHGSARNCDFRFAVFQASMCSKGTLFVGSDFSDANLSGLLTRFYLKNTRNCSAHLTSFNHCNFKAAFGITGTETGAPDARLTGPDLIALIQQRWGSDVDGHHFTQCDAPVLATLPTYPPSISPQKRVSREVIPRASKLRAGQRLHDLVVKKLV